MQMNSTTEEVSISYKYISVLHQNINGLINKADALSVHLQGFINIGKPIDVICITEHNMKSDDEMQLMIVNYSLAAQFCRKSRDGGSCILVRNIHKYKSLPDIADLSIPNIIECCAIELTDHKIIIITIYRVPRNDNQRMRIFFHKLINILNKLCYTNKKVIISGDFNIDILKRTAVSVEFKNIFHSYNLRLSIIEPTRLCSKTCIDNIIHNIRGSKAEVIELALSDHTAQVLTCPVKRTNVLTHWYVRKRDFSQGNIDKFIECLQNLNFNEVYLSVDSNEAYDKFSDLFELFYNLCFPYQRCKISSTKKPAWIPKGIINSVVGDRDIY
jgi:exonuclease III